MRNYLIVFFGGCTGVAARYWLSGVVYRVLPTSFPYEDVAVKILDCFLLGVLMVLSLDRFVATTALRVFLAIGILVGFTTFSSFSYETVALLQGGRQTY